MMHLIQMVLEMAKFPYCYVFLLPTRTFNHVSITPYVFKDYLNVPDLFLSSLSFKEIFRKSPNI